MFLKNRNISSKIKRSQVTDYAALIVSNFIEKSIDLHMIKRILGECLLKSSLPGKASRTLVDIARLAKYREY